MLEGAHGEDQTRSVESEPAQGTACQSERRHLDVALYVAGETPKAIAAYDNLKRICEERLADKYSIEVIDLVKNPQLAHDEQILAVPTLVRKLPEPVRSIIGDLSDKEKVLVGLDLIGRGG